MSPVVPLTVRLATSRSDRPVTAQIRDLQFGWTDPGGYSSCRISLHRPLSLQPEDIAYYGRVAVYDARTGLTVWEGRLEDPGRSAGADGQVWDLVAVGGQAHTKDRTVSLVYVDQDMQAYRRVDNVTVGGTNSVAADPGGGQSAPPAIVLQYPQGITLASLGRVVVRYDRIMTAGQHIARYDWAWDAGRTVTDMLVRSSTRVDGGATGEASRSHTMSTAGGGFSPRVIGTDFPAGRNTLDLHIIYTGAGGAVADDTAWASFKNPIILATRYSKNGVELVSPADYPGNYVLASDVVADLLGRLLVEYDGAGATVTPTSYQIQQLAYPDGIDASRVLADLMGLEGGYTWRVWERNATGKYRFEWVQVPATVRYEADLTDGYEAPGSADGLYNAVTVRWKDPSGEVQQTVRTTTVPALSSAGLVRQGQIDLGSEVGSLPDAQRAGDQWLADRRFPPNAGRLKIGRPILDRQTGRMVQPWEIRPGLIRVRGILPRQDALNNSARDGVTIFRIRSADFRASDAAATLDLDSYPYSAATQIAALQTARPRR